MNSKYFFCYSHTVHKFIQTKHKIKYICAALNENDNRKFWLYEQSDQLGKALTEYHNIFKGAEA